MSTKIIHDQMGRRVSINFPPKRIISLVPSQTELLHYLGLKEEVIGITKFCIHPEEWYRSKTRVGGTKNFDFKKIKELQPDLIIGNKEENEKVQMEALFEDYPVWMSDIKNLEDAFEMIKRVGILTNKEKKSSQLFQHLQEEFSSYQKSIAQLKKISAAYFIWRAPYMVAATDTFINEMLKIAGFSNVFEGSERYPTIDLALLKEKNPDVILLSSEPYPFKEIHFEEFKTYCPNAKIIVVDGELFSWYGSRLLSSIKYFKNLYTQLS